MRVKALEPNMGASLETIKISKGNRKAQMRLLERNRHEEAMNKKKEEKDKKKMLQKRIQLYHKQQKIE